MSETLHICEKAIEKQPARLAQQCKIESIGLDKDSK